MSNNGNVKAVAKVALGSALLSGTLLVTAHNIETDNMVRENVVEQNNVQLTRVSTDSKQGTLSTEGDLLKKEDLYIAIENKPERKTVQAPTRGEIKRGSTLKDIEEMQKIALNNPDKKKLREQDTAVNPIAEDSGVEAFKSEEEKAKERLIAEAKEVERLAEEARLRKKEEEKANQHNYNGVYMTVPGGDRGSYTYMSYTAVKNKASAQWKTLRASGNRADNEGFWRNPKGDYFIAMGTYYGKVGDRFHITLQNGTQFTAMLGDMKADQHTIDGNKIHYKDGSVIEFIMDSRGNIPSHMKNPNGFAVPSKSNNLNLKGKIKSIKKIG